MLSHNYLISVSGLNRNYFGPNSGLLRVTVGPILDLNQTSIFLVKINQPHVTKT